MSRTSFQSESKFYSLPECQGTPCSRQAAHLSSNVNEVIRAVLNSLFFFTKRFDTHQKHQKHKDATKQKHKTLQAKKKKKMLLKNISGEKSHLFAYLRFCAFCVKERKWKKEKSPHNVNVLNTDVPHLGSCKNSYTYMNLVVGTRT